MSTIKEIERFISELEAIGKKFTGREVERMAFDWPGGKKLRFALVPLPDAQIIFQYHRYVYSNLFVCVSYRLLKGAPGKLQVCAMTEAEAFPNGMLDHAQYVVHPHAHTVPFIPMCIGDAPSKQDVVDLNARRVYLSIMAATATHTNGRAYRSYTYPEVVAQSTLDSFNIRRVDNETRRRADDVEVTARLEEAATTVSNVVSSQLRLGESSRSAAESIRQFFQELGIEDSDLS